MSRKSLLRAIHDGSAEPLLRWAASIAAALVLISFAIAACGTWRMFRAPLAAGEFTSLKNLGIGVTFSELVTLSLASGMIYVVMLGWIWSRDPRKRAFWLAGFVSLCVGMIPLLMGCVAYLEPPQQGGELMSSAILPAVGAVILLMWTWFYRSWRADRPVSADDGLVDLRCPACRYRMIGLTEARCPECGRQYTLDQLVGLQDFAKTRTIGSHGLYTVPPDSAERNAARSSSPPRHARRSLVHQFHDQSNERA